MEEQSKYYTPSIDELYIGYKCQTKGPWQFGWTIESPGEWREDEVDLGMFSYMERSQDTIVDGKCSMIRTKYLDSQDIESLRWKHVGGQLISEGRQDYEKPGFNLKHFPRHSSLFISTPLDPMVLDGFEQKIFNGEIKSINELKKIMKYLKIN